MARLARLGDLLLPLKILSHFLGAICKANQLREGADGPKPEPAHAADEDQHQDRREAMQRGSEVNTPEIANGTVAARKNGTKDGR